MKLISIESSLKRYDHLYCGDKEVEDYLTQEHTPYFKGSEVKRRTQILRTVKIQFVYLEIWETFTCKFLLSEYEFDCINSWLNSSEYPKNLYTSLIKEYNYNSTVSQKLKSLFDNNSGFLLTFNNLDPLNFSNRCKHKRDYKYTDDKVVPLDIVEVSKETRWVPYDTFIRK